MKKLIFVACFLLFGSGATHAQCLDIWKYVYTPTRFTSNKTVPRTPPCVTIEGRLNRPSNLVFDPQGRPYSDGDISFLITLRDGSVVVVEEICAEPDLIHFKDTPAQQAAEQAAKQACWRYYADGNKRLYSRAYITSLTGSTVRITGFSVSDYGHNGKRELHPLSGIRVVSRN